MIACPNCNHQNPEGATQCEACYTPLPAMSSCPNCGATVQADAHFCGQCGFNLKVAAVPSIEGATIAMSSSGVALPNPLDEAQFEPLVIPDPLVAADPPDSLQSIFSEPTLEESEMFETRKEEPTSDYSEPFVSPVVVTPIIAAPNVPPSMIASGVAIPSVSVSSQTQLQTQTAALLHTRTNTTIEIPANLQVIHIGKPNNRVPPDIDVSGFSESEVVSRIHADIRLEGDAYYLEDMGSSNGTYVNNLPLSPGNRHRLRPGDRISLGKGDKVSFLFQIS